MSSAGEKISFQSAKAVISTAATAAMFVRLIARDYVPRELRRYAITKFQQFLSTFSNEATLLIDEYEGLNKNRLFHAAELYIGTIVGPSTMSYRASLLEKEKTVNVSLGGGPDEIVDKFGGIQLKWSLITKEIKPRYVKNLDDYQSTMISETRYLQLTFHKKHKNKVINEYLPYVLERFEAVKENKKPLKLYTLNIDNSSRTHPWQSVNLDHPAKFETLAMDDEMKNMVVGDLDMFLKRKELYRKVGKAWKRGYLLYGPPGTGKSSLVAAMANYLNFDVYDLELSGICSDSLLRKLLITTANRSILVVEDIDASIDLTERRRDRALRLPSSSMYSSHQQLLGPKTVTLSGLLNFIDGLWSSIGDERIIIFTTNHMEKLDPALLRPGRMDVHIHMSYCTPCGFKLLAKNYLGITEHPLVFKAEEMIASSKVTPAEVGEQLLKSEDPVLALNGLIKLLEEKEEEEKLIGAERVKKSKSSDRVKEVMKIARAEMNGRIIRKDEAADALKTLFGFLEQATGNVDTCDPDSSLRTLVAIQECEETLEI